MNEREKNSNLKNGVVRFLYPYLARYLAYGYLKIDIWYPFGYPAI